MKNRIYLDHAATTPVSKAVLDAMLPFFTDSFGNASSVYGTGREARKAVETARRKVAAAIGAEPRDILFTGGGSESDNLAVKGTAFALQEKGKHIITTAVEHPAVLNTCKWLEKQGFEVTYIRPDTEGRIRPEDVRNAIREEFGLGPDCFIFFTLARYAPEKGLETLLASLKKLRTMTSRPFVCAIAGEGRDFDSIGREIRRLSLNDCVLQLGYRTDVETLLCSADAYVSSALYNEAMSFSILEAMRCGLALAVTDVGAGRELAARCGYVSAPGDAAAMAESLLRLMSDPEASKAMGREARRRVVEEYDLERQADKLLAIYKT